MKLIVFDCDSTLSEIEGVDELARLKGEHVFQEVAQLTNDAMDGNVQIDEVFERRLAIIQPSIDDCEIVGKQYISHIEPTALKTMEILRSRGWNIVIVSGGFAKAIEPFAQYLSIDRVEAVPLSFHADKTYHSFDATYPTTYNGGKPEIIKLLKQEYSPETIVMVGDGVSDLETKNDVDLFVGFGKYTARDRVKSEADEFIYSLDELLKLDIFS